MLQERTRVQRLEKPSEPGWDNDRPDAIGGAALKNARVQMARGRAQEQNRLQTLRSQMGPKSFSQQADDCFASLRVVPSALLPNQMDIRRARRPESCHVSLEERLLVADEHLRQQRLQSRLVADQPDMSEASPLRSQTGLLQRLGVWSVFPFPEKKALAVTLEKR